MINSKLIRVATAVSTIGKIGLNSSVHKLKKTTKLSKQTDEDIKKENAKIVFKSLTKLRGTALKFAQLLSLESTLLPKEYMEELEKACYKVTPLNKAVVRKIVKNELGEPPEDIFRDFKEDAFAAASLGQVHRATNDKGDKLAVKLQYPGIDTTLKNDMQMIKIAVKTYMRSGALEDTLDEIEDRLREEIDYKQEAKNLIWFRKKLENRPVLIPKVFTKYSNTKILAMEFIDGIHISEWLKTKPSQKRKNALAQNMFELYAYSFFELKSFQADSNIGNYLVVEDDDGIAFLDFGCIKKVKSNFPIIIKEIVKASQDLDKDGIITGLSKLGLFDKDDKKLIKKYYDPLFEPLAKWLALPFLNKSFKFSKKDDYASQVLPMDYIFMKEKDFKSLDKDLVFFLRGLHGLYKIFERMEVEIKLQKELK